MKIPRKHSDNNDEPAIFSDLAFLLMIFFIVLAGFAAKYTFYNLYIATESSRVVKRIGCRAAAYCRNRPAGKQYNYL